MKFRRIFLLFFLSIYFLWSLKLLEFYINSDQVHYTSYYEASKDAAFIEIPVLGYSYLGSIEPISLFILWLGAKLGIAKNVYISFLNVILAFGVIELLRKYKAPWYIYFFVFSNYYFLVLMTGAERLKISYIFLVYSVLVRNRISNLLLLASLLAHLQSLILLLSLFLERYSRTIIGIIVNFRLNKRLILSVILALAALFLFSSQLLTLDQLELKVLSYTNGSDGISEMIKSSLLLALSLFITKNRLKLLISFVPLFFLTYYLGGMRVNMVAFTFVFYFFMKEYRMANPIFILVLVFFSMKSVSLVNNIFVYGTGFYAE